jgi:mannose-1-phosphate guanylyltransferase
VLGDEVVIEQGAQVFGRVVLGRGTVVRAGAQLEDCVLFDDVEIGADSEVFGSVVCSGARIGANVTLEGSIVGARASVGPRNELRHTRLARDVEVATGTLIVDR